MTKQLTSVTKPKRWYVDFILKIASTMFSFFGITALLLMFSFILKEAFPAYNEYGLLKLYFTANYSRGNYGMLGGLALTLISAVISVMIALAIATRCAFFIHFRLTYGNKLLRTIINVIASVPSVLFGVFAFYSLSKFTNFIFGTSSGQTLINGIVMLTIMIMPILISMILNQLKMLPKNFVNSAIALGNSKTYAIYTIVKKEIRPGVIVATITALGRAIGETMALSILLTSIPGNSLFPSGFFNAFLNNTMTLGVVIAKTFFDDVGGSKSHLFAASILLFLVVMVLVGISTKIATKKRFVSIHPSERIKKLYSQSSQSQKLIDYFNLVLLFVIFPFSLLVFWSQSAWLKIRRAIDHLLYYIVLPFTKLVYPTMHSKKITNYYIEVARGNSSFLAIMIRILMEILALALVYGFTAWLIIDILASGVPLWTVNDWKYSYYKPGANYSSPGRIANPLVFTMLLILLVIALAFPIAFFTAIYLTEYAYKKRHAKVIRFFLDSLGGTPSILFGIFGSIFFIHTLNLRVGKIPYSFIAGGLTMVLVVIPTFTRSIEQTILKVPNAYRLASYALGASKARTIFKVIIPQSLVGITTGIILTAGRVIAETAPIYLTFGILLTSGQIGLLSPGHTITTQILSTFWTNTNFDVQQNMAYKLGSAAVFLSIFITILAEGIIPLLGRKPNFKITTWWKNRLGTHKEKAYA